MRVKGSRVTEIEVTHALQSTIMLFHIGSILQYHCILEYHSVCPKFFQNRSGVQHVSLLGVQGEEEYNGAQVVFPLWHLVTVRLSDGGFVLDFSSWATVQTLMFLHICA